MGDEQRRIVAYDDDFTDPHAGVLTYWSAFDLLPARNKQADPHLWVTVERYSVRRPFHRPRVVKVLTHFAQTRLGAQTAHDQAVTHVREEVKRNWKWWRRVYWPRSLTLMFAILGALWFVVYLVYLVIVIIDKAAR